MDNSSVLVGRKVTCCVCRSTSTSTPSSNKFCVVDTFLYLYESAGDKPWYLHRGKLPLYCVSNLPLGVTNEGREANSLSHCWGSKSTPVNYSRNIIMGCPLQHSVLF